ncbi:MAG: beta-lactamase family protein [Acidimicrobiales bacterium]|nr:beta-lactamase family protein [Acidimicrobiales bacterium]
MDALAQVERWPATTTAVGVTHARATLATRGDAHRRFPLASVTKILTSMAVWVAVEEGTVALDTPAGPPGSTIRHLLAHASGLAPDERRAIAPPGTRRIYSNAGFEVLADVVAAAAAMPFAAYLHAAVCEPLGLTATTLEGSPAHGARSSVADLLAVGRELLAPRLVAPATLAEATAVAFPGLDGVLPGFGRQAPNDWGLGVERRDAKRPHWTAPTASPRTFGHFGRSGTFCWVDPDAGLACACLTDLEFGPWAAAAWPRLSAAVLTEAGGPPG